MLALTERSIFDSKEQTRFNETGLIAIRGFYSRKQIGQALAEIKSLETIYGPINPPEGSSRLQVLRNRFKSDGDLAAIIAITQQTGEDLELDLNAEQAGLFPVRTLELGPSAEETYYIGRCGVAAVIGLDGEIEWGIGLKKQLVEPGTVVFTKGSADQHVPFRATSGLRPFGNYSTSLVLSGTNGPN